MLHGLHRPRVRRAPHGDTGRRVRRPGRRRRHHPQPCGARRRRGAAMMNLADLRVEIFADGADLEGIKAMYAKPWIRGFTTNPTLMRKAGVADYRRFAAEVLQVVSDRPVSFEVFADEFAEMERQAREIAAWGPNVDVKIPVTNTRRESAGPLIQRLSRAGVQV